jgi:hypothetical protein
MKTATQEDAAQLKGHLKGLNGISDGLLREINLHTKTSVRGSHIGLLFITGS